MSVRVREVMLFSARQKDVKRPIPRRIVRRGEG